MSPIHRLQQAISGIKEKDESIDNAVISSVLGYKTKTYLTDILSQGKAITDIFLDRLEDKYGIRKDWIKEGKGKMSKHSNETFVL